MIKILIVSVSIFALSLSVLCQDNPRGTDQSTTTTKSSKRGTNPSKNTDSTKTKIRSFPKITIDPSTPDPSSPENSTPSNMVLYIDGKMSGFIKTIEGGNISAEVYEDNTISGPKYDDLTLTIILSTLNRPLYDWITAFSNSNYQSKNVTIYNIDNEMKFVSKREFFNVLIKETVIPAMNAASNDNCYLHLTLTPETSTLMKSATGQFNGNLAKSGHIIWRQSNFKLVIEGLEDACKKISEVGPINLKKTDGSIKITFPVAHAQEWQKWFENFVIKGNNGEDQKKKGSITYLEPDLNNELFHINLFGISIYRLEPIDVENNPEAIHKMMSEIDCSRKEIFFP